MKNRWIKLGIVDTLVGFSRYLPEIKAPIKEIPFKQKLTWTALILVIFFVLGKINVLGRAPLTSGFDLGFAQTILASETGTLITAGIGPIVMASIFLQLFIGAKIINLNLSDPAGRAKFQALQKLLSVILCFVEAFIYVNPSIVMPIGGISLFNPWFWAVGLQIAAGSLALLYMDEILSKYGIGSGVSLFIAAGVSGAIFWNLFRPALTIATGTIPLGYFWQVFTGNFLALIPILAIVAIFLVVVFAEGMHVNIPITMGHRGTGGRYPVKFLYVSNMPVILAMALFMNLRVWALFVKNVPIIGQLFDGVAWATMMPNIGNTILFSAQSVGGGSLIQGIIEKWGEWTIIGPALTQGIVFLAVLIVACVVFGWFWVQMGGQSTEAVAAQLERSGMQIPGFRKDKRVIEKVLSRYIPPITIIGSIFVALLSGLGDFVLAGIASGTGILLTVGIVYRFYEEIAKSQADLLAPLLGKL